MNEDYESEGTSSSLSEDDTAEALTTKLEKGWMRTLAAIKSKDPRIYDNTTTFYSSSDDSEDDDDKTRKIDEKPMFIKDYNREVILKKDGKVGEYEDEDEEGNADEEDLPPGYYEEQDEIKKSFQTLVTDSDSDDELLVKRDKSKEEKEAEEDDYVQWLKGVKDTLDDSDKVGIEPLKDFWSNPQISEGDAFLRDFILDKKYCSKNIDVIPTYEEIVQDVEAEEDIVDKQDTFEHKFNFRFEEPDDEFIKSYPRTIGDSLRQKSTRRQDKKKAAKQRKEDEKAKKMEHLKRITNEKKREILSKIALLREATGKEEMAFDEANLEDEFDPSQHDQMIEKMFEGYDEQDDDDDEKPVFDDLDLDGPWDAYADEVHCDDPEFNMDADYDASAVVHKVSKKKMKKLKKQKNKAKNIVAECSNDPGTSAETGDATQAPDKTIEEYMEDYYDLHFEDLIGDIPCRFRYRSVVPNDFGLTTEEILSVPDKELNEWVPLKKICEYRTDEEEARDVQAFKKRATSESKYTILPTLKKRYEKEAKKSENVSKKKKKNKKQISTEGVERIEADKTNVMKNNSEMDTGDNIPASEKEIGSQPKSEAANNSIENTKMKKKRKRTRQYISDDRLKAYGLNPKKIRYMKKT